MERYCIRDDGREFNIEHEREILEECRHGIQRNAYVVYQVFMNAEGIFDECQEEIEEIISTLGDPNGNEEVDDSEEGMYRSIFTVDLKSELVELDMFLHIYYTLLYEKNRDVYVPLVVEDWEKEKKEEFRKRRKNYRKTLKKDGQEKDIPFQILEKGNRSARKGERNNGIKILDFAPDIRRLAYQSKEFRKVFRKVGEKEYKKYEYKEMRKIFESDMLGLNRKEEIWLEERLLGVNLVWAFHSFFYVVFRDMDFVELERKFQGIIKKIIHAVMSWGGIYSRGILITKMKIIYELRKRHIGGKGFFNKWDEIVERRLATPEEILQFQECDHCMVIKDNTPVRVYKKEEPHIYLEFGDEAEYVEIQEHVERRRIDAPEDILTYLYDEVIIKKMDILADAYKTREIRGYCNFKNRTDIGECLREIEEESDRLIKKYFDSSGGYFLLKNVEKPTEETLSTNLYKLIQKIVIGELNN